MSGKKRPDIRAQIVENIRREVADAERFGLVVRVYQEPLEPLAMRNYRTVVEVREQVKRDAA